MNGKIESFSKEVGDIYKNQMLITELKNTINEIKILLDGLNSRLEMNLNLKSELDWLIEIIQSEQNKEKEI